jgi:hypothetical protein
MDRDEMSNLYRGSPIDVSYQVSVHLAKQFQKRIKKISQSEKTWLPQAICVDIFNSSPLKPLGQMNRNLVGSIYGRSSVKITHFVPIH